MNHKVFLTTMLGALCTMPLQAGVRLSTPFVDEQLFAVPVGKTVDVVTTQGQGMWIHNQGTEAVTVAISAQIPAVAQLRRGAQAIPSTDWLTVETPRVEIPAQGRVLVPLQLQVPAQRKFRRRTFQVMIWTHMVPETDNSTIIGAGLLSRLRFTTQ